MTDGRAELVELLRQAQADLEAVENQMAELAAFTVETNGRRNADENARMERMWAMAEENLRNAHHRVQLLLAAMGEDDF